MIHLLVAHLVLGQLHPDLRVKDEGTRQGFAHTLNCVGSTVSCALDAGEVTLTVTGSADAGVATDLTCTGCVADSELVSNYSGTGACGANQYAHTLNDNGAPSCSQPGASGVTSSATGNVSATDVQSAIAELDSEKAIAATLLVDDFRERAVTRCQISAIAGAVFACDLVASAPSVSGCVNGNDNDRQYLICTTSGALGASAGITSAGTQVGGRGAHWRSRISGYWKSSADLTSQRVWWGLSNTGLGAVSATSAASVNTLCAIAFDPANSANWRCCAADASNQTCTDMTGSDTTPDASTPYWMSVSLKTAGACACQVQTVTGSDAPFTYTTVASLSQTSTVPANTVGIAPAFVVTATVAATRQHSLGRFIVDHD